MNKKQRAFIAIACAIAFALLMRAIFDADSVSDVYSLMTAAFLIGLPVVVGVVTIYVCSIDTIRSKTTAFFMPFIPIFGFLILTLFLKIEGWGCWAMMLPVFLIFAGIGGLIGRYFRLKKESKTFVYLIVLLPFFISPIEKLIGAIPGKYKADTVIDIYASDKQIWDNVTRVKTINPEQDSASLIHALDFPRPIKAELDKEAIGGKREAIFDKGLIFHEEVIAYEPLKAMTFTIHANPYEIPSTTMDKHIVIGGDFFDVLTGTYQLEKIGEKHYKLHLFSYFKMHTTFNFYASIWANWIMKDIQQNILKVVKSRAEFLAKEK